jgi:hypothetical protein
MFYTQMLFAIIADKLIFGHNPELLSLAGSSLILSSTIYVAVMKNGTHHPTKQEINGNVDEERGLILDHDQREEEDRVEEIAGEVRRCDVSVVR